MIIVDAAVHIWRPEAPDRPWMPGRKAHLPEPLSYEKLSAMMDEAGVSSTILVPPSWEGDRNDYSLEAAQKFPNRFAVMGRFAINKPEDRPKLETWRSQKGMLGIRVTMHHAWDRGWITDGTADWLWPAAERLGIPLMLYAPFNHKDVADVAARHPRFAPDPRPPWHAHFTQGRGHQGVDRRYRAASETSKHIRETDSRTVVLDAAVSVQKYSPLYPAARRSVRVEALLLGNGRVSFARAHQLASFLLVRCFCHTGSRTLGALL